MANENVIQVTDTNFDAEVLNSEQPVLVDFSAEWCPPCKAIEPVINDLASEYKGKVKVGKVDLTDGNQATGRRFGVQSIPTLLMFKKGQLVQKLIGAHAKKTIKGMMDGALGVTA